MRPTFLTGTRGAWLRLVLVAVASAALGLGGLLSGNPDYFVLAGVGVIAVGGCVYLLALTYRGDDDSEREDEPVDR